MSDPDDDVSDLREDRDPEQKQQECRRRFGSSPDGIGCVVVATAELQKTGIDVDRWRSVHGAELTEVVPTGVEIFLNPVGAAPFRLACIPN
ncbi:hypothetical protein [Nocardia sp. NBC_00416]|uniref:hypothetical protein n=1 Tax=Nocardia sp. NBC_00416 TaxID=2975991 RepID=UPI002E214635